MRDDEFNFIKVSNEKEGFSNFEFGHTQNNESTSFSDNSNNIRDEVNDNPTSNAPHKNAEQKRRKKEEDELREQLNKSNSESGDSSSSSSSSSGASNSGAASSGAAASGTAAASASTATSVVSATVVAVASVSTIVGINLYIQAQCKMNILEATAVTVNYDLDLTDTNDDNFIITIENKENNFYSYKDLEEGNNTGEFIDLTPETKYQISILDTSSDNFSIHTEEITTLKGDEPEPTPPEPGPVVTSYLVTFDSRGGSEVASQTVEANGKVTKPDDPTKNGFEFKGWTLDDSASEVVPYNFDTPVTSDITLFAVWQEEAVNIYKVSFYDLAVSIKEPIYIQEIKEGECASKPSPDPTREGYKFDGWSTSYNYFWEYDFSKPVTKNFSLFVTWDQMVDPVIRSVTWDQTISFNNYTINYHVDYDDFYYLPMLDELRLVVNHEDEDGEVTSDSFLLPIGPDEETTYNVPLESENAKKGEPAFDLMDGREYTYYWTYLNKEDGEIYYIEGSEEPIVINDEGSPEVSPYSFTDFSIDSYGTTTQGDPYLDYTLNCIDEYQVGNIYLAFTNTSGEKINIPLTDIHTHSGTGRLDLIDYSSYFIPTEMYDYALIRTNTLNNIDTTLSTGTILPNNIKESMKLGVTLGNSLIYYEGEDYTVNGAITHYLLPVTTTFSGRGDYFTEELIFQYYENGNPNLAIDVIIPLVNGTQYVPVTYADLDDQKAFDPYAIYIYTMSSEYPDEYGTNIYSNTNPETVYYDEEDYIVFGGKLADTQIDSEDTTNSLYLVTTVETLYNMESMSIQFDVYSASSSTPTTYTLTLASDDYKHGTSYIRPDDGRAYVDISFEQIDNYETLLKAISTHPTTVTLTYKFINRDEHDVTLYDKFTFNKAL